MVKLEMLKGKTKSEIISICRKDGYKYEKEDPRFFDVKGNFFKDNPLFLAGIKPNNYIRFTELTKKDEEILIVDVFTGWHQPLSDSNIVATKLFSSENKSKNFTVGYAWDITE